MFLVGVYGSGILLWTPLSITVQLASLMVIPICVNPVEAFSTVMVIRILDVHDESR